MAGAAGAAPFSVRARVCRGDCILSLKYTPPGFYFGQRHRVWAVRFCRTPVPERMSRHACSLEGELGRLSASTPLGSGAQNLERKQKGILNGGGFRWHCWDRPLARSPVRCYGAAGALAAVGWLLSLHSPILATLSPPTVRGKTKTGVGGRVIGGVVPRPTQARFRPHATGGQVPATEYGERVQKSRHRKTSYGCEAFQVRGGTGPLEIACDCLPRSSGGRAARRGGTAREHEPARRLFCKAQVLATPERAENALLACHKEILAEGGDRVGARPTGESGSGQDDIPVTFVVDADLQGSFKGSQIRLDNRVAARNVREGVYLRGADCRTELLEQG
ncbi:hypothetical protein ACSSS7_008423 [Eimeria intestinalis]